MESSITRRSDAATAEQSAEPDDPGEHVAKPDRLVARRQREAVALRANLRRRKDQARARDKPNQE
jgi:hypothetical protein